MDNGKRDRLQSTPSTLGTESIQETNQKESKNQRARRTPEHKAHRCFKGPDYQMWAKPAWHLPQHTLQWSTKPAEALKMGGFPQGCTTNCLTERGQRGTGLALNFHHLQKSTPSSSKTKPHTHFEEGPAVWLSG